MLEVTIRKYQNRIIEAAQVITELIELAKKMREGRLLIGECRCVMFAQCREH